MYETLLRRGQPDELIDWIDGAFLVDLWDDLRLPQAIRRAWDPVVALAGAVPSSDRGTNRRVVAADGIHLFVAGTVGINCHWRWSR